jgi:hypothetical protein
MPLASAGSKSAVHRLNDRYQVALVLHRKVITPRNASNFRASCLWVASGQADTAASNAVPPASPVAAR